MNTISNTGIQGLLGNINSIITQLNNANTNNNKLFKEYIKSIELKLTEIQKNPTQMKNFLGNLNLLKQTLKKKAQAYSLEHTKEPSINNIIQEINIQEISELITYLENFRVNLKTEFGNIISLLQGVNSGQAVDKKKFLAYLRLFSKCLETTNNNLPAPALSNVTKFEGYESAISIPDKSRVSDSSEHYAQKLNELAMEVLQANVELPNVLNLVPQKYNEPALSLKPAQQVNRDSIKQLSTSLFPLPAQITTSFARMATTDVSGVLGDLFNKNVLTNDNYKSIYKLCRDMIDECLTCIDISIREYIILYANAMYPKHTPKQVWMYVEVVRILRAQYAPDSDLMKSIIDVQAIVKQVNEILLKYGLVLKSKFKDVDIKNLNGILDIFINSDSLNLFFCIKITNILDYIVISAGYHKQTGYETIPSNINLNIGSSGSQALYYTLSAAPRFTYLWPENYDKCINYEDYKRSYLLYGHKKELEKLNPKQIMSVFPQLCCLLPAASFEISHPGLYGMCIPT